MFSHRKVGNVALSRGAAHVKCGNETDCAHVRECISNFYSRREDAKGKTKPGELAENQILKGLFVSFL